MIVKHRTSREPFHPAGNGPEDLLTGRSRRKAYLYACPSAQATL